MSLRYHSVPSIALLLVCFCQLTAEEPAKDGAKDKKTKSRIRISKETTRIEGPIDKDGYVDYLEALNQQLSQGVTPENNAAIPICTAIGPYTGEMRNHDGYRVEFFKRLGVEVPPRKGDYLVTIADLAKKDARSVPDGEPGELSDAYYDQLTKAMQSPWSRSDLPVIATLVSRNEKPLAVLSDGVKLDRCYMPMVGAEKPTMIIAVLLPFIQSTRELARVLKARAMLRLNDDDVDGAMEDMLTCQRLGLHIAQGTTLIERLVGIAINGIALDGAQIIAQSGKLTSAQALKFRQRIEKIPPLPSMADSIDTAERFMFLDSVNHLARGTDENLLGMIGGLTDGGDLGVGLLSGFISNSTVDWNETAIMANRWYDKIVAAGKLPTYRQRVVALGKFGDQLEELMADAADPGEIVLKVLFSGSPRKATGQQIGTVLVGMLMPAIAATNKAEARNAITVDLTRLSLAIAAYKKEKGVFPGSLDQLESNYIAELPRDFYVEKPLTYRRTIDGYVLYALGPNGKDDRGFGPNYKRLEGDDLAIHFPRPKEEDN